jgi:ABC-2 type transport system ATP-binding protein
MSNPTIVAEGLTKHFGRTVAVEDVSFEVHAGQVVGFIGHNGSGKTTTLRMLVGHVHPTAGRSEILGRAFAELENPLKHVGILLGSGLHPGRTARDHLRVNAALGGLPTDRIDFLLDLVGLANDADRRAGGFSSGMRQRLGIATALLADPEVIIFDEPATGLDPPGILWLRDLLRQLADNGRTVLVSSHQLAELAEVADRVLIMDRGSLITAATLEELEREGGSEVVVRSPGAEVIARDLHRAGVETSKVGTDEVRVRDAPASAVSRIVKRSSVPVSEIRAETASLEETFLALTDAARRDGGSPPNGDEPSEPADAEADAEAEAAALEATESALDDDLGRVPALASRRTVAVLAPTDGLGRTTLAFLLADVLASTTRLRTLAVALSNDRERMCLPAAADRRSTLCLSDLLDDIPGFDDAARISPYVSAAPSGAHTLCGPAGADRLATIEPGELQALLDFAGRFYELVVLDVGDLADGSLRALVRGADQIVLVGAPEAVDDLDESSPVLDAIESERSERATLVLNRVDRRRAVAVPADGPHVIVPRDRDLIRALDAGDFRLSRVPVATRIALKRFALAVLEGLA